MGGCSAAAASSSLSLLAVVDFLVLRSSSINDRSERTLLLFPILRGCVLFVAADEDDGEEDGRCCCCDEESEEANDIMEAWLWLPDTLVSLALPDACFLDSSKVQLSRIVGNTNAAVEGGATSLTLPPVCGCSGCTVDDDDDT